MGQDWKVAITPECAGQLGIAPRKIQKRVQKQVYQELRSSPDNHTRGRAEKKINGPRQVAPDFKGTADAVRQELLNASAVPLLVNT